MATNIDREGIWKMKDKSYRKTKPINSGDLYKKRIKTWHKKGAELNQRLLKCAQHGRQLDGESPLWGLVVATISQRQGCPSRGGI